MRDGRGLSAHDPLRALPGDSLDGLIDSWADPSAPPLSEHLALEVAAAFRRGRALDRNAPVPGCACPRCLAFAQGGSEEDARRAEEIVERLARLAPGEREAEARRLTHGREGLLAPGILARLAGRAPGAVDGSPDRRRRRGRPLHRRPSWDEVVQDARRVPILQVARRLALGRPVDRGREVVVRCPLHDDRHPSLRIDPKRGVWYCDPCGEGGDGIRLVRRALHLPFPEAVRWLTGEGRAA